MVGGKVERMGPRRLLGVGEMVDGFWWGGWCRSGKWGVEGELRMW